MIKQPTVYLVGAGPGDESLITRRGFELIKQAQVLIYDRLGTSELLQYASEGCELIDVGKAAGNHKSTQSEINKLLVAKARENKLVVRLKGGDPFVFGRGGEELLYLAQNGIQAEVVPGVTSGIAAPCCAGIPLTHRGYASSVAFVTGHEAQKEQSAINWAALAGIETLVFFMGLKNLPEIAKNLIEHGKKPSTPAAIIQNGALPTQKTVEGTLKTIAELAEINNIETPAIIVVGAVAALRKNLNWFENRPLFGKTAVLTRARAQASKTAAQLILLGAKVIECPVIKIVKQSDTKPLEAFINGENNFSHLVFTSVNGVNCFIEELLKQKKDLRFFAGKKIICIGPSTAEAFTVRGIIPDYVPKTFVAESLLPYFKSLKPTSVAVLRAEKAREMLPEALSRLGHRVEVIPVYHTEYQCPQHEQVVNGLINGDISWVIFTSSSTAEGFFKLINGTNAKPNMVKAASIGPITSSKCRELGYNVVVQAEQYTINGLIEALVKAKNN